MSDGAVEIRYGSRKFILALLIIFLGCLLNWYGHLNQQLVDLMKWVAGMYFGLNVTQKAAEMFVNKVN